MLKYQILTLLLFLLAPNILGAAKTIKIISGAPVDPENPGAINAVALVKENGKIFCTGSLVAPNIVATAKHCLIDKKGQPIKVYFGDDTTLGEEELYRDIEAWDMRHPLYWEMTFPSFDVAWVRFSGHAPKHFKALPILSDPSRLHGGMEVIQVGFGDHHPEPNVIRAGQKLWGRTRLKRYINNPRFFHILLFEGEEGQGSCHGDSGGPAYVKIEGKWHIIGVTNGFDLILTPEAMEQTGDEDFPYHVDCAQNQSLYSFLGAHGHWIEETSESTLSKSGPFKNIDRAEANVDLTSLEQWCESRDIGSPQWNLLKILLDQKVDELGQHHSGDFYEDCEQITNYLEGLERVYLDYNQVIPSKISFAPLNLLPSLKELNLLNYPKAFVDLESIKGLKIKKMQMKNLGLETLDFLKQNTIEEVSFENNPLYDIRGILNIKGLKALNLSGTSVKDLRVLNPLKIKELTITSLNSSVVFGLETIAPHLESFDARNTVLASPMIVGLMENLRYLRITGDNAPLDLSKLRKLEELELKDFFNGGVIFPNNSPLLKVLSASQCDISELDFLKDAPSLVELNLTFNRIGDLRIFENHRFPFLKELNLSGNPILDVKPLASLEALGLLRLFRTPLQRGQVPKTEVNCPQNRGSEALRNFCAN